MAEAWPNGVRYKPHSESPTVEEPFRAPLSTEMDDGSDWGRPSTTLIVARLSFTIPLTNAEIVTLKGWLNRALVQGTLPFTMPIWTGAGFETKTCKLVQPPAFRLGHGLDDGSVSLTLDVQDW